MNMEEGTPDSSNIMDMDSTVQEFNDIKKKNNRHRDLPEIDQ